MSHPFHLVDVFGAAPFLGNPLAVIHDADDLDEETMQRITRWLNFSETAFLLHPTSPEADYRVRIFTLEREMPFAGHPTLGSCHAWLTTAGRKDAGDPVVQECGLGLVSIQRHATHLAFAAPRLLRSGSVDEAKIREIADILRIDRTSVVDAQWADNGPGWVAVLLESADAVLRLEPVQRHATRVDIGVVGPYPEGSEMAFELRAFFTDQHGTLLEDPVTGSLNAAVAQWLFDSGRVTGAYTASQGARRGRTGRIYVTRDQHHQVWVGGGVTTLFEGTTSF